MTHRLLLNTPFDILVKNFFETSSPFQPASEAKYSHPVDIYENKMGLFFEIACTGLTKDQIDLSLEGDILKVSYEKPKEEKYSNREEDCNYIHKGISKRSFNLGYKIAPKYDLSQAEAEMENGLLKIYIPFSKESKSKTLKIK
jgi:HSP20 family molecular chaperone IbpA